MREYPKSKALFEESCRYLAGGVGAEVRSFAEPHPLFTTHGAGSRIYDADGNEYIDYLLAYGPLILGHAPVPVVRAVTEQAARGSAFGTPHPLQIALSKLVVAAVPCFDLVRYSNTGSEAVLNVVRLARAFTGRNKVIKFEGHYHGWTDEVFASFHPEEGDDFGTEDEPKTVLHRYNRGQPKSVLKDLIALPWNNLDIVRRTLERERGRVAAILTEPLMSNCGVIPPKPGYLEGLRELCDEFDVLLIFDEVITGQRVALGGAQELYGVAPDLATCSKALGGGVPIVAVGGRRDIMQLWVERKTINAGTFNANPLVVAAAHATITELSKDGGAIYPRLTSVGRHMMAEAGKMAEKHGVTCRIQGPGPFFCISFTGREITQMRDAFGTDSAMYSKFRRRLLDRGVHIFPTDKGLWYLSAAHTDDDVEQTLRVLDEVLGRL